MESRNPLAAVFGCAAETLSDDEKKFFSDADPLGFILFQHNCRNPDQVRGLIEDLRATVGRPDAPVLVDQEGGRVQRLRSPHWREAPSAGELARLPDPVAAEAVRLNARLMAEELFELGFTVNCAPVLDVPRPGADPVIGDRAYGDDPERVAVLGRAVCEGLLSGGVLPVIKHIPGHGRGDADSHKALPRVEATMDDLWDVDFKPFCELNDMPWAMTAHVLYTAIDDKNPATLSATAIDLIRDEIGFGGVLVSDSLSMEALSGSLGERTAAALKAGCDLALYCHDDMDEMRSVAGAATRLSDLSMSRIRAGEDLRAGSRTPLAEGYEAAVARLEGMLDAK